MTPTAAAADGDCADGLFRAGTKTATPDTAAGWRTSRARTNDLDLRSRD